MSITITDASGRTLRTNNRSLLEFHSSRQADGSGIELRLGADAMRPYLQALSKNADCFVHCYPNAGLPNPLSATGYDEKPEDTASSLRFREEGLLNLAGGCWTTPEHIHAISEKLSQFEPRNARDRPALRLSGLEPFELKGKSTSDHGRRKNKRHRFSPFPKVNRERRLRISPQDRKAAG